MSQPLVVSSGSPNFFKSCPSRSSRYLCQQLPPGPPLSALHLRFRHRLHASCLKPLLSHLHPRLRHTQLLRAYPLALETAPSPGAFMMLLSPLSSKSIFIALRRGCEQRNAGKYFLPSSSYLLHRVVFSFREVIACPFLFFWSCGIRRFAPRPRRRRDRERGSEYP